ncbi:MAG: C39 family peptidase [Nitrospirae bacterium]|nr:C39 family peptidase [Nitrospirota bacterium]
MIPIKNILIICILYAAAFPNMNTASSAIIEAKTGGMTFTKKNISSLKDLKFKNVIRQTKDYSCGAAALATILTHYFGKETSEAEVLDSVLSINDSDKVEIIKHKGVSLLDLKRYGEALGYEGKGYRLPDGLLKDLGRPAIALITNNGYSHFIVLKGVKNDRVYFADPARGNMAWSLGELRKRWNGILLIFRDPSGGETNNDFLGADSYDTKNRLGLLATQDYLLRSVIGQSEF